MFQIRQSCTCNRCKTVTVDAECRYILDLSSNVEEGENSVNDLLSYPKSCVLHCSKCYTFTHHDTQIVELPKVLILLIGRGGSVQYDPQLDMQPFMANPRRKQWLPV